MPPKRTNQANKEQVTKIPAKRGRPAKRGKLPVNEDPIKSNEKEKEKDPPLTPVDKLLNDLSGISSL